MLNVEKCRKILGHECPLSEEELKNLLVSLPFIAEIALDEVSLQPAKHQYEVNRDKEEIC